MLFELRNLGLEQQTKEEGFKPDRTVYPSVLCDELGRFTNEFGNPISATVPGRGNYSYHRLFGGMKPEIVKNETVPPLTGTVVFVGYTDGSTEIEVLRRNNAFVVYEDSPPSLLAHAIEHQPGGSDPLTILRAMLLPLRPTLAGGMLLDVASYEYDDAYGSRVLFPGQINLDMTSYIPVSGSLYAHVYLDINTNTLLVELGPSITYVPTLKPEKPDTPVYGIAVCYVWMHEGQTEILTEEMDDARRLFVPNRILEAVYQDILTQLGELENQFDVIITTHLANGM